MKRRLDPFLLGVSAILALGWAYCAWRLAEAPWQAAVLAVPFLLVWAMPAYYWRRDREHRDAGGGGLDEFAHGLIYLCMGWINFLVLAVLGRDLLLGATAWLDPDSHLHAWLAGRGAEIVLGASLLALAAGLLGAKLGPRIRYASIPVAGLDPRLDGLRIVQISDLHVGPTIGRNYVKSVVEKTRRLGPDWIVLTGDLVDGPVDKLAEDVAPLAELAKGGRAWLVLGNHDYYSGAAAWTEHFRRLGYKVLLNAAEVFEYKGARVVMGGVIDPAVRLFDPGQSPRPDLANAPEAGQALRILLAHNPKLAPLAERAGFDLQISGHTHAGQFFPWTLVVRHVHAPHVAGLSREGGMPVYVSAGTGTWGPPVRFGTAPELSVLQIVAADSAPPGKPL